MLRRTLYPGSRTGPAERVGRTQRPLGGVDQAGLPCMSADWASEVSADSELGESLRM